MAKKHAEFVELQERLRDDANGSFKREILDKLDVHAQELKQKIDGGLPPEEFAQLTRLKRAVDEAKLVVERAWTLSRSNM